MENKRKHLDFIKAAKEKIEIVIGAAKPFIFARGFLAATGGEMLSNYFKNGVPTYPNLFSKELTAPRNARVRGILTLPPLTPYGFLSTKKRLAEI